MADFLKNLGEQVRLFYADSILYISALLINLLVIGATAFTFLKPKQSIDVLNGLISDGSLISFWISIVFLSLVIWYSTVISLYLYDFSDLKDEKAANYVLKFAPYLLSFSIFVIIFFAFRRSGLYQNPYDWMALLIGTILLSFIYFLRYRISVKKNQPLMGIIHRRQAFKSFSKEDKWILRISIILIVGIMIAALIINFQDPKPVWIPQFFAAFTLICFYLGGFVMVFSVFWGLIENAHSKISLTLFLVLAIPIFSLFNNNHQIRRVEQKAQKRETVSDNFKAWINEKEQTASTETTQIPVFLFAAEGGGIRSLKWTALVLDNLFDSIPELLDHTYALSGVSGGSVGIVFQHASLDHKKEGRFEKLNLSTEYDFLSPVTFGLLAYDNTQSILPFPVNSFDRSKWLEDSWFHAFKTEFGSDVLNMSIGDYFDRKAQKHPNIFLNSTSVETGQKVLISNLELPQGYFENIIDLEKAINVTSESNIGIPLKTAASLSARFPIVSSAGTTKIDSGSISIVDGGYHDNTGIETLLQLLNMMINTTDKRTLSRLNFVIIYIRNSTPAKKERVKTKNFLIDLQTPVLTLASNWENRSASQIEMTNNLVKSMQQLNLNIHFLTFHLDRNVFLDDAGNPIFDEDMPKRKGEKIELPLGWYLSKSSNKEILRQVNSLKGGEHLNAEDSVAVRNYQNILQLKEFLN